MATPVLEVSHLSTDIKLRKASVHAVGDVTFSIEQGETLGLVGESGCGKSITGLSIMQLLPNGGHISQGSIKLEGRELVGCKRNEIRAVRGNEIAMIFQDSLTSLNPTMSVGRQIAEQIRRHKHISKKDALSQASEALALVGFPRSNERVNDYPHQFSGGQRQRVMIAIALSCDPKLLIADEPTTALDVTIQAQILGLLDELKERLGMAVLLVTHDMGVVAGRADRVNVMYAGRIVESAPTIELFQHMHHPYTQALLASIPLLTQDRAERLFSIPGVPPDLTDPPKGCRFAARCSRATDKCREEEPSLEESAPQHLFACWHPVDGPIARTIVPNPSQLAVPAPETAPTDLPAGEVPVPAESPAPVQVHEVIAEAEATTGAPDEADLLVIEHAVREYPVRSGFVLQRKVASVKAVSDVSFTIGRGETFGLVGESGCGKTTLGKLIVGLEKLDGGKISLHGTDISKLSAHELRRFRKDLQMMFQDPIASLDPRMRIGAILQEPMRIQGVGTRRSQRAIISELLSEVGLPANSVERFPHEFSGGQRQRIGLARALTLNPQVIVADEPVSALDVSIRSQVLNLMKRLQKTHGLTYVVISHDLAVVNYLANRIGVMYLGKVVEVGSGDDVYRRPVHHYTAGLIATAPEPDPTLEKAKRIAITGELPSPINPPSGCRFRTRCPAAQEICAEEEPPLRAFHSGHFAACHFPLQEPMAVKDEAEAPAGV